MVTQFDYLYEYLVIYREGGLKGAADLLNLSTSTLSKHLSALESELGFKLLERGRHIFEPTDMGVKVWDAASSMLEIQNQLQSIIAQGSPLLVYPMVNNPEFHTRLCSAARSFTGEHSQTNIAIDQECTFNNPFSAMENGKIDILAYDVYATPHFEEEIFSREVGVQRFQAVVSTNNPLAGSGSVTMAELCEYDLSQLKGSAALLYYTWRAIKKSFAENNLKPRFKDRRIYMPAETATIPVDDDEVLILYKDSEAIHSFYSRKGYEVLEIEDIEHAIAMACRSDNQQAVEFIRSI